MQSQIPNCKCGSRICGRVVHLGIDESHGLWLKVVEYLRAKHCQWTADPKYPDILCCISPVQSRSCTFKVTPDAGHSFDGALTAHADLYLNGICRIAPPNAVGFMTWRDFVRYVETGTIRESEYIAELVMNKADEVDTGRVEMSAPRSPTNRLDMLVEAVDFVEKAFEYGFIRRTE